MVILVWCIREVVNKNNKKRCDLVPLLVTPPRRPHEACSILSVFNHIRTEWVNMCDIKKIVTHLSIYIHIFL